MRRAYFKNNWIAAALVAPQLLIIFVFFYWPTAQALYWAFTLEQPWGGGNQWVGLENFQAIVEDEYYWNSVMVSIIFAFFSTLLSMGMALVLAIAADRQLNGYKFYRVGLIWPYAVAAPAVGLAFRFIFNPSAGLLSHLNQIWPGIWDPIMNGDHALAMVIFAGAWKQVAYNFIFFLAGLQAIPRSLTEASAMDGAGVLRRVRDIQLPLLAPTAFFLLVINITDSFTDSFGIVDTMTAGGPARATDLMVFKIYEDGFRGLDYSGAAAQSIILMLLVMVLTFFQFRYIERRVHYT
ncbi:MULTISPECIES: ABC transporter permease subunit [Thalassobaculum]|uniref:sn-glycerol-3-phosphate transport system permease protein UgpA n=1 Tax=Thalassobaculum litoreum DSM 18839 TaxID=1123362 RepID=A0A8G2BN16_9PROT|nr:MULTISPECIES: ABC transporter permease subunit [Thalassobaculum]SDG55801.1 sn-glycerol 3-phosphate transport system permease protein [Thalassobaculum litoreum DSM 18839]